MPGTAGTVGNGACLPSNVAVRATLAERERDLEDSRHDCSGDDSGSFFGAR